MNGREHWMSRLRFYYLCTLTFWLLNSCGLSEPPPVLNAPPAAPAAVAEVDPAAAAASQAPAEPTKIETPFQYNPEGRRDPFKSIIVSSEKQGRAENLHPLQRKELAELRLIGIVWGGFGYGAVIQTPDGKGYPVRKGTRMGLNNGVISRITNREVVVQEKFIDIFSETKIRDVVMELHPQKEGLE
jgi:type IV pilus assembly protein PilP